MKKFSTPRCFRFIAGLFAIAASRPAVAQLPQYKHGHLNIFPVASVAAQRAIAVDGVLSDWKPDAFVQMYADPDLKEFFRAELALAYDANGLVVAAHFTDRSPLVNHIDPRANPFSGWNGDALQLRFVTDPKISQPVPKDALDSDSIAHLTAWYYTDGQEPVLDVRFGMNYHGAKTYIGADSGLVFKPVADGYNIEGRVPWSVLKASAPQAGDRWLMTLQPLWGDANGKMQHSFFDVLRSAGFPYQTPEGWGYASFVAPAEAHAKLVEQTQQDKVIFAPRAAPEQAGIKVTYTNPKKGFVSLAICRPNGSIVRTLLAKAMREAGPQTEMWDGKDDDGNPVPPGKYLLKALVHDGIKPRFVTSVMQSGNPSWGNSGGHYGWGADHDDPLGAASDAEGNTYLLWYANEGGNYLIKVDRTGQKQWGASGRGEAVATDGKLVYVAHNEWHTPDDAPNRAEIDVYDAATGRYKGRHVVDQWSKKLYDDTFDKVPMEKRLHDGSFGPWDRGDNIAGLAIGADRIFCSLYYEDKVVALDPATYEIKETYAVKRPINLAFDARSGNLYAVSGSTIAALKPGAGAAFRTLVASGLEYPFGVATDQSGNIWVSTRGHQMQVLGFDANGKSIGAIGKKGGRPWEGAYDPNGVLMPAGLSVDSAGHLWVPEEDATPRRVSEWDVKTHKLVKEYFGACEYAPMMAPNLDDPREVYLHNTRFIVDYDKGTWHPEATIFRPHYQDPSLIGSQVYGFMGTTWELAIIGGKTFAYDGWGGIYSVEDDHFKPVEYIGGGYVGLPVPEAQTKRDVNFVWQDTNHDGLIQNSELRNVVVPSLLLYQNNMLGFGGTFFPGGVFIKGGHIFRPSGLRDGIPVYPKPEDAPLIPANTNIPGSDMNPYRCNDVWPSFAQDWKSFYAVAALDTGNSVGGGHDGIYKFDDKGKILWRYSRAAFGFGLKAPLAKPGDLFGTMRIAGEVQLPPANGGEIVGITCYRGYFGFLNEDGLFVDQVGYDDGRSPDPNFDVFFIENFSGFFFKNARNGKVYLFCGDVDGRILELQGWNTIQRFNAGSVTVTPAQYQSVVGASSTGGQAGSSEVVSVQHGTPTLDDSMAGWEASPATTIALDETRKAEVRLAYDANNLYARFEVPDTSPWQNANPDWRYLFKSGDAVDVQLGPLFKGDGKRKNQAGDVRVMIAPQGDEKTCIAVGMWPKTPPGLKPEPQLYQSPTGEESFEKVSQLNNVKCAAVRKTDSYVVVAAIPWKELGMTAPAQYSQLEGDVGVLQSDGSGTRTVLRRYHFNQDTGIVNDIPNEVRVVSRNWGVLNFQ
jgi:hypothetical protein